ncbi:MAG TPA: YHS domain-containing (seleno)protein [Limnobacter sp.]|uniref:YHS domain-containing (seleno)protein n=1 Tax=Limnobacter sp. TaxID=2003368 RepID=UPI002ED8F785
MKRLIQTLALATAVYTLTGCSAMQAQNPGEGLGPVNAIALEQSPRVMLGGADVVAYQTDNRYVQGLPQFNSTYKGVDFYFASLDHKVRFDGNPEQYIPQYGGYCANGISFAIPWGGNATDFWVKDGKTYIFGGEMSRKAFMLDPDKNIALADEYWKAEVEGHNSFVQRAKRLVFRVPHYKTGAEQAREVEAAARKSAG